MNKGQILNEIKRTATANGGQPLGERTFYRETGIRKQDWHGKFWARFSEAIIEAGFTPIGFPDEKQYSNEDMLDRYVKLVKELGQLPTNGDLRLKKSRDEDFPNSKTYETRFGSKLGLVGAVSNYCASRPEHKGVLAWCQDYIVRKQETVPEEFGAPQKMGYVYLIKMGKFCKIGRSYDFMRRGREITFQLPERTTIVHSFQTDDPSGIEAYWHRRFAEQRREGEWFELSATDIAAFKRRKTFM